jgi:hypothetical protein
VGNSDIDLWVEVAGTHNRYHNNIGTLSAPTAGVVTGRSPPHPDSSPAC